MNHKLININSTKTRSIACKMSHIVSIGSARAVKKAFSAEFSPFCAHLNDQSPPEKRRMKVLTVDSQVTFCNSRQYKLKLLCVYPNFVHNHPQTMWNGEFSSATYQSFLLFSLVTSLKIRWARDSEWWPLSDVTNSTTIVEKHNRNNGRNLCLSLYDEVREFGATICGRYMM